MPPGALCRSLVAAVAIVVLALTQIDVDSPPPEDPAPTYVRPGSKTFLVSSAAAGTVVMWTTAAHVTYLQYAIARKQGMYPKGLTSCALHGGLSASWELVRSVWGKDTLGVAVRSILNNTREFVSLIIALRISVTAGALYAFYNSFGAFSYSVPNLLSTAVMASGSKQLGEGQWGHLAWNVKFFHFFGLTCGLICAAILLGWRDMIVAAYSNDVSYDDYADLIDLVWPLFVLFQPVNSMIAVMGPLLVTTQNYVFWGQAVAVCFFAIFLPLTIAAAVEGSVFLLFLGDFLYNVGHLLLLIYKVSFVELTSIMSKAKSQGESSFLAR